MLGRGRVASLQRAMPGLPVQVEKCASGEGESLAPGVAESLFLFVSISQRLWLGGGSTHGRLRPGERSGAARGRARRLPGAVRGGQGASRLPPGAGGSSAAHGGSTDREKTENQSFGLEETFKIRSSSATIRFS